MYKEKKSKIAWWIVYGVMVVGTALLVVFTNEVFGENSMFSLVVSDNPTLQYLYGNAIPNLLRSIQIITVAITLGLLLHLIAKITFRTKKSITISRLLLNFVKWAIAIAAIFFIMAAWGANTTMILASAGVFTLIVGLGSQALVADILAGLFIVFEGDFQVGDIIIIDDWRGEVQSIGVRTTRLMDAGGNIKIVNNSEIKTIINQTQELSIAKCYVGVSYNMRIEKVESIIADNIDKIKEKIPGIVEGPFYKGVSELGDSAVILLFVAKCKENDIYQVERDLNREIKILFDDNNIEIPFTQVVVHMEEESAPEKVSKKEERKANEFKEEQSEMSKDIEIKK